MREAFRADSAASRALKPIVAYGRGGTEPLRNVFRIHLESLLTEVSPNSGKAIGLQFQAHRQCVLLAGIPFLKASNFALNSEYFLHVMTYFMGDNVSLREFAGSAEPGLQFIEEPEIEVNLFVARAVERTYRGLGFAAGRRVFIAVNEQRGVMVACAGLRGKIGIPGPLNIVKNRLNELKFGLFLRILLCLARGRTIV